MRYSKRVLPVTITIILLLSILLSFGTAYGEDPFKAVKDKMSDITEEQKATLQYLFDLEQEIKREEKDEEEISVDIEKINQEIKTIDLTIENEKVVFVDNQQDLKLVLKNYQKRGPGSYLEIILNSDSLTTFLRRLNILKDLTRNTERLLTQLEQSRDRLNAEKAKQAEKLVLLEEKQKLLKDAINSKLLTKKEKEIYLASLEEERAFYQERSEDMQFAWKELKNIFGDVTMHFSQIITEGDFPEDALKISFSLSGIKGSMSDTALNDLIAAQPLLPNMVLMFNTDMAEVKLPEHSLTLKGKFAILEGRKLKFEASESNFFGISLGKDSIEELFKEGDLLIDLEPLIGSGTLKSVKLIKGNIEVLIDSVFF